jgi:hypothetical protein
MNQKAIAFAAIAGLCLAGAAQAAPSSGFLGTWVLDLTKAPPPAAGQPPLPKSVTRTVKDAGGGKWTTTFEEVGADGKTETPSATYSTDGAPAPVSGAPDVDMVSVTSPDANTLVVTESKAGKAVAKVTVKLSADSKQTIETVEAAGPDGKPVTQTQTWNRK